MFNSGVSVDYFNKDYNRTKLIDRSEAHLVASYAALLMEQ